MKTLGIASIIAGVAVIGYLIFGYITHQAPQDLGSEIDVTSLDTKDAVGTLLKEGEYDAARKVLEDAKDTFEPEVYANQQDRITVLESYSDFYSNQGEESYAAMIERIKSAMDGYFATANTETLSDFERSKALLFVSFLYFDTWSDPALLEHIANVLQVPYTGATTAVQDAVLGALYTAALDIMPNQEGYLRRAWIKSKYLTSDEAMNLSTEERNVAVTAVANDYTESAARNGFRFITESEYYNMYVVLANADVLEFLYQEQKLDDYTEVEVAYRQAIELAGREFRGHLIVEDIIRLNYAASIARFFGYEKDLQKVVDIINPVAERIREFDGKNDSNYEGVLVMLRDVPTAKNQNAASIYKIFTEYSTYNDIPQILGW